ncbi:M48 family metallopeptidase [Bacillus haynesii]|uniref:M48 family metallopeptidase n=1 Tax=Bacillus haynesii TaxID=1925021 RepID=UPI0022801653|nr:M48 family metallopeptidase [Bacillus haynesii]MCY7753871.1 M48 family metallopeptidase [Bacillus haynesii]MCY7927802.1 M48 family metallopeptidase [Bacillus haynesii]MCY8001803.1 M48 family metallopeptidase [Bacillus haynesii]MCY8773354.1 M48 family metallopeptidase [Bacillus haynesii]MCY9154101.1 M48 family metallopeptidase [Bacillus haynesii]
MRKWIAGAGLLYVLYGLFFYWYLFMAGEPSVPEALKGTSADPATFMNERELMLTEEYSKIKDFLFFIRIPFEWFLFFILLIAGLSKKMKNWAEQTSKRRTIQITAYVFALFLIVTIISLPLDWISYQYSLDYGISTQTTASWIKDQVIDFWISFPITAAAVIVFYFLIKKNEKRWWFYAWCLTVPVTLFLFFLQPVVIDPLYNDFYPLKNKELEQSILKLADQADIPANHVYEVNMSEKTNALNAYVTGIGANKRIVLWDTTLNKLDEPEILFIMAHEMGHYVMKHVYIGLGGYLLLSLAVFYVIDKLYKRIIGRYGKSLHIAGKSDLAALPLLLMLMGVISFASSPFTNAVSRHQEKAADQYAIELTNNSDAAVATFQELSKAGLSEANPPFLVKIFKYGHPTIMERIQNIEQSSTE